MLEVRNTDKRVIQYAKEGSYYRESLLPKDVIHWSDAGNHLGEMVSIYGEVTSTSFDWCEYERSVGYPELGDDIPITHIDIGAKYPNEQLVRIVILGSDWNKFFYPPDVLFKDTVVIIWGEPYLHEGMIHVRIDDPRDISLFAPIEGLYVNQDDGDVLYADCYPVFSDECDHSGFDESDDDDYWDEPAPSSVFTTDEYGEEVPIWSDPGGNFTMYYDEDNGWMVD